MRHFEATDSNAPAPSEFPRRGKGTDRLRTRFRLERYGVDDARTPETLAFAQNCSAQSRQQDCGKDDGPESVAKALVATRDPGERRARSQARRLHAAGSKADRSVAEALGGTQFAPQGRLLSLGVVDADVLYQPRRQDLVENAARAAAAR